MKNKSSRAKGVNAVAWYYSQSLGRYDSVEVVPAEPVKALSRLTGIDVREHSHPSGYYSAACVECRVEGK